jgi:hypothetical protein
MEATLNDIVFVFFDSSPIQCTTKLALLEDSLWIVMKMMLIKVAYQEKLDCTVYSVHTR